MGKVILFKEEENVSFNDTFKAFSFMVIWYKDHRGDVRRPTAATSWPTGRVN